MRRRYLPIAAAVLALATPHSRAVAQATERANVLATVQKLFDAMRTRDTALLTSVFDSSARLLGISRTNPPSLTFTTPAQFGAGFARMPAGDVLHERMYDPEVRIEGNVAQVWAYYTLHRNSTFIHCGIDAFMLMKVGTTWKITQIADTRRTEGCTHTTPGGAGGGSR
jgi:hypothetical protein